MPARPWSASKYERQPNPLINIDAGGRDERDAPEILARLCVRQVDFHGWQSDRGDGIAESDGGVSVTPGVEDDACGPGSCVVERVNQSSFVIRLS